ncbi:MAG: hypothetical protein CMJ72_01850 [Planctomycetaceae bacterium]|nr:hypothetical protein [Planctomycetaceae bacterium]HCK40683.1 hypothetical protein [Planctomycetaceae bacterium]
MQFRTLRCEHFLHRYNRLQTQKTDATNGRTSCEINRKESQCPTATNCRMSVGAHSHKMPQAQKQEQEGVD